MLQSVKIQKAIDAVEDACGQDNLCVQHGQNDDIPVLFLGENR